MGAQRRGRGGGQPRRWLTHHSAPAVPAEEATALLQQLDDVELVVVVANVGLVQGTIIVLVDLCGVSPRGVSWVCSLGNIMGTLFWHLGDSALGDHPV